MIANCRMMGGVSQSCFLQHELPASDDIMPSHKLQRVRVGKTSRKAANHVGGSISKTPPQSPSVAVGKVDVYCSCPTPLRQFFGTTTGSVELCLETHCGASNTAASLGPRMVVPFNDVAMKISCCHLSRWYERSPLWE